jgi:pimeloyl-ACP methyl ester carboxylesterase
MNLSNRQTNWLDITLYPFKKKYLPVRGGHMHYVDEGQGEIILFIHGTPTWSFLYRDFIKAFSKTHRCIAMDHIGFGLSDKPENAEGTPQAHGQNVGTLIEQLDLKNITLVVHDFGGPIGLSAAIKHHNRIKQMVVFNTWLWETKNDPAAQKINKILHSWIGKFLYLRMNFSVRFLLKKGYYNKEMLTPQIHKHYLAPFPNAVSRWSLLKLGKALVGASDWYQEQWNRLNVLDQKPWLFLWGTKDEFITPDYLQKWKARFPNADVKELVCGHFVQEEKSSESIQYIHSFLQTNE